MILKEATYLIDEKINEPDANWPDKPNFVVQTELTIERQWGWILFYNFQRFLESGNVSDVQAGNASFIFNRQTSKIVETGTAHPIEHYIEKYEKNLNQTE